MHRIEVKVCMATHCHFAGAETIVEMLEEDADLAEFIAIQCVPCMGKACEGGSDAPIVEVGGTRIVRATPELVIEKIEEMAMDAITGTERSEARHA